MSIFMKVVKRKQGFCCKNGWNLLLSALQDRPNVALILQICSLTISPAQQGIPIQSGQIFSNKLTPFEYG